MEAKNSFNLTLGTSIIWLAIAFVWSLNIKAYDKSVSTFIVGGFMLPFAFHISKIIRTTWTMKGNLLQPLGLWLNFAQLFYFPFLVFTHLKSPDYFVRVYANIACAYFFPYAWFYKTNLFSIFAGLISIGSLLIALFATPENMYLIPLMMSAALVTLTILLYMDSSRKANWIIEL